MKLIFTIAFLLIAWGCGSSDGSSEEPAPTPDVGISDMMIEVDAAAPMTELTASPTSLAVPTLMGERASQVNFELIATGGPVNLTRVALDLPGTTSRLLYKRTFMTGIDFDGTDRFTYPLQVLPEMPLPMTLEVAVSEVEMLSGTLVLEGDFEGGTLELPIVEGGAGPQLTLPFSELDFGRVAENTTKTEVITVTNSGATTLELQNILLRSFGIDFSVNLNGEPAIENPSVYTDPDGDGEAGVAPGNSFDLSVTYAPMSEGTDDATLVLRSNDAVNPEQEVQFVANSSYSCMAVTPEMMDCDGVLRELTVCDTRVVVSNCHESEPLIVDEVFMNASTDAFFIDDDSLPSFPHTLALDETLEIEIRYLPGVARSNHRGNLYIHANDLETPNRNIQITGFTPCATTDDCPMEYACMQNECVFQEPPE